MSGAGPGTLFAGVDRAALAAALGARLRTGGVPATLTGIEVFTRALSACPPTDRDRLYWLARTTLVRDRTHLAAFDAVFAAVFDQADVAAEPLVRRSPLARPRRRPAPRPVPGARRRGEEGRGLPWATLPAAMDLREHDAGADQLVPERLPSDLVAIAETPFEQLDPATLARLGAWLETAFRAVAAPPDPSQPCAIRPGPGSILGRRSPGPAARTGSRSSWCGADGSSARAACSCSAT